MPDTPPGNGGYAIPREPGWAISSDDSRRLSELITRAENNARHQADQDALAITAPPPGDITAAEAFTGRDRLTAAIAGTTDRSTRAWANARRNLSRYRNGQRHPDPPRRAAISRAVTAELRRRRREQRSKPATARIAHVEMEATITVSDRPWTGIIYATLTGPDLDDFRLALAAADHETATQILLDGYELPYILHLENPADFTIKWDVP